MNQEEMTAIKPFAAIEHRKRGWFERREDYPIIPTASGDHIIMPIKDYRKFRGDTSFWQFIVMVLLFSFMGMAYLAYTQPPIYVEKPFVVEKAVPTPVPTRCLFLCGK